MHACALRPIAPPLTRSVRHLRACAPRQLRHPHAGLAWFVLRLYHVLALLAVLGTAAYGAYTTCYEQSRHESDIHRQARRPEPFLPRFLF